MYNAFTLNDNGTVSFTASAGTVEQVNNIPAPIFANVAPNAGVDLAQLPQVNMEKALAEFRSGEVPATTITNKGTYSPEVLAEKSASNENAIG